MLKISNILTPPEKIRLGAIGNNVHNCVDIRRIRFNRERICGGTYANVSSFDSIFVYTCT